MKLLLQFFRLIRWPNLVFIALTQYLFFIAIAEPVLGNAVYCTREVYLLFYVLSGSSVLIAAAGYIINDYFDLNIDTINKPERLVVDHGISRRWAMFFHFIFSLAGILMGFYIGLENGNWFIGTANTGVAILLWVYSTSFKKRAVIGNVIISMLTSWTLLVVYFDLAFNEDLIRQDTVSIQEIQKLFRIAILYAAFAFIITFIREVVKDMEDVEGDRKYGCKTMPIIWGIQVTKLVASIFSVFLLALMLLALIYILQLKLWAPALYHLFLIMLPGGYTFYLLQNANTSADFGKVSTWIKLVMLSGILSMLLFKIFA
ncbi:MAG: geranylgeranylglycerol-phosphate geranylgeranyltransferase [Bacteroidota bacterium]